MEKKKESFINRMKKFFRNQKNIGEDYNKKIKNLEVQINNPHISELERGKKTKELKKIKMEKKKAKQANVKAFIFGASGALALGATGNIMLNNINESMPKNPPSAKIIDANGVDYFRVENAKGSVFISGNPENVTVNGIKIDKDSNGNIDESTVNEQLEKHAEETMKNLRNKI